LVLQGSNSAFKTNLSVQYRGRSLIRARAIESEWDGKYPQISRSWRAHWGNLNALFNYPKDIRKAIYTTNAIESLNSVIRKSIKKRKLFPRDNAAKKVVYLAIQQASKKWAMPLEFGEQH